MFFTFCIVLLFAQNAVDSIPKEKENKSWVVNLFSKYMDNLNYYSVAALMTVESSFIPFPSEVVVPPAAYQACNPEHRSLYVTESKWINILLVILFATLGALLGSLINYYLAFFVGRSIVYWFVETKFGHACMLDKNKVQKAENIFVRYGKITTFVCRFIPGIRQLISVPAGLAKMKMSPFIFYSALGAGIWNVVLALVGYLAQGKQDMINKYSTEISYTILVLALFFVGYLVYRAFRKSIGNN